MGVWEAYAEYSDGTTIKKLFAEDNSNLESDFKHEMEEWLLARHEGCTFYSVDWVSESYLDEDKPQIISSYIPNINEPEDENEHDEELEV